MPSRRCNLCEVEWPHHNEACAYLQTAKKNVKLLLANVQLRADFKSLAKEHADLVAYVQELEQRLNVAVV